MLCPTCRYNLVGLRGDPAVVCPECGRTVMPGDTRRLRGHRFLTMLLVPWPVVAAFTFRTGSTMSSSDVELNGRVLPWMVLAATVCSTAGGILMTVAREPGRRRERSLVLGLSIVLNIVLFAVGMFLGLACKYIGV